MLFTVTRTEAVTPRVRRIWLHTDDMSAFAGSAFTDRYVKLMFLRDGVAYPENLDLRHLRSVLAAEELPAVRTYTALFPDLDAGTMAIDFVIHGAEGVAGPWAAAARPGDTLVLNGPGGAYAPDPTADWHLLVGDESAMPAITAALAVLPDDAVGRVILHVDSAAHEPALEVPANVIVRYVHRQVSGDEGALVAAVRALEWLPGRVHAFVHGEAEEVMHGIRPHLLTERSLRREQLSVSGYWRRGRTEESFREWKSEFARAGGDEPARGGGRR